MTYTKAKVTPKKNNMAKCTKAKRGCKSEKKCVELENNFYFIKKGRMLFAEKNEKILAAIFTCSAGCYLCFDFFLWTYVWNHYRF